MEQNLSLGCTTFCVEACSEVAKVTNTGKGDDNERWQMKSVI